MKKLLSLIAALMVAITLSAEGKITYTASEKLPETSDASAYGLHVNAFYVSITEHSFRDGKGTILFDGDVTSIGSNAFYGCSKLTSISMPSSVTFVGKDAFYQCSNLEKVNITDLAAWCRIEFDESYFYANPLYYAHHLYLNDSEIKDLVIPNTVTSLKEFAFLGCSGLTSVTIGNSLTNIGGSAFEYCSNISSVKIANSVKTIGNHAFFDCSKLTAVHITDLAAWFSIEFGNEYANPLFHGENLFLNGKRVHKLVIPNSITSIKKHVLENCKGITSITIPTSVTSAENNAFERFSTDSVLITDMAAWCGIDFGGSNANPVRDAYLYLNGKQVKDFVIPNSVTNIKEHTFEKCRSITSVTTGNSLKSIGYSAFSECPNLTSVTIGNSVTDIEGWAFYNCQNLASVSFGSSVANIGTSAFSGCSEITDVSIANMAAWCEIYFSTFSENPLYRAKRFSVNGTEIKHLVIPETVSRIGRYNLYGCTNLTAVTIPASVKLIDSYAFAECTNLKTVYNNSDLDITKGSTYNGHVAWYADNVINGKTVGDFIIRNDTILYQYIGQGGDVVIPENITTIRGLAFNNCLTLKSITIPESVTNIKVDAFKGCTNLTSIVWNAKKCLGPSSHYDAPFGDLRSQITDVTFGDNVETIPNSLCYGMSKITSINLPASVKEIGEDAFYNCSGLTSIIIPNAVTNIKSSAFYGCSNLKLVINTSLLTITRSSNNGYAGYYADKVFNGVIEGDFVIKDGTILSGYLGNDASVTIPDYITSVGEHAFYKNTDLATVIVGKSVTNIDKEAFYNCTNLKTVYNKSSINITAGSSSNGYVAYYADRVFKGEAVGDFIIMDDVNLTGYIGQGGEVTIPETITKIEDRAFNGCTDITSVIIPNSVTNIGKNVFQNCTAMRKVTMGSALTNIGAEAFAGCTGLIEMQVDAVVPPFISSNTFKDVSRTLPLYVQAESVDSYRAAQYWNEFTNIQARALPKATLTLLADSEKGAAYGEGTFDKGSEVQIFAIANSGYEFSGWSDGYNANPRTLTLSEDMSLTANFEATDVPEYTVNVTSGNPAYGSAQATEWVLVEAIPNPGCSFVNWSDGSTENPRYIPLTGDIELTANFAGTATNVAQQSEDAKGFVRKVIVDGQLHIVRDDNARATYNVQGARVE